MNKEKRQIIITICTWTVFENKKKNLIIFDQTETSKSTLKVVVEKYVLEVQRATKPQHSQHWYM